MKYITIDKKKVPIYTSKTTIGERELIKELQKYKEGWAMQLKWLREPENAKRNNIFI
jgi:hypothetical protein